MNALAFRSLAVRNFCPAGRRGRAGRSKVEQQRQLRRSNILRPYHMAWFDRHVSTIPRMSVDLRAFRKTCFAGVAKDSDMLRHSEKFRTRIKSDSYLARDKTYKT